MGTGKVNIPINSKIDFSSVKTGQIIKIDDGKIKFSIISIRYKSSIQIEALDDGIIYPSKGINFPGTHGSTFGGNPLAMSVGNAVLDKIFKKGFLKNVQNTSKYFHLKLKQIQKSYPTIIKEVRGVGLLIGLQLFKDQTKFIQKLMDNKLLTIKAADNVVRILPPLTVKKQEIDLALKIIEKVCKEF